MLVYSVGAPSAYEIFAEIQVLHTLRRGAALAIVSDDENPATVIATMRSGAQGYFGNSMPPDLALQALSFVLHGGTYFPPTAIMASHAFGATESRREVQEHPLPDAEQQHHATPLGLDDGVYEQHASTLFDSKAPGLRLGNGPGGVRPAPEFTERQYAVLTCLCLGDPNKVIGRKLGMTETTVKVHVRRSCASSAYATGRRLPSPPPATEAVSGRTAWSRSSPWIPRRRSNHLRLISRRRVPDILLRHMARAGSTSNSHRRRYPISLASRLPIQPF